LQTDIGRAASAMRRRLDALLPGNVGAARLALERTGDLPPRDAGAAGRMNVGQGNPFFRLTPSKEEHSPGPSERSGGARCSLDQAQQPGGRARARWLHERCARRSRRQHSWNRSLSAGGALRGSARGDPPHRGGYRGEGEGVRPPRIAVERRAGPSRAWPGLATERARSRPSGGPAQSHDRPCGSRA
jgi:hypothetical protein